LAVSRRLSAYSRQPTASGVWTFDGGGEGGVGKVRGAGKALEKVGRFLMEGEQSTCLGSERAAEDGNVRTIVLIYKWLVKQDGEFLMKR
jgi:hypothetical protein